MAEGDVLERQRPAPLPLGPRQIGRVGGVGTWSAGWRSMMLMMGESRKGTVIRLADGAEIRQDA